ncbi:MAG TPA: DUF4012 domain-containing protein [Dehalococcoidia bacterium]|nr:DUF4012 domain-containing protein [Dehalococcoidia bacterium]
MLGLTSKGRRRAGLTAAILVVLALVGFEAYRAYAFYHDVSAGKQGLLSLEDRLDLSKLEGSETELLQDQQSLQSAKHHLDSARSFSNGDPVLAVAAKLPIVGKQVRGLRTLVSAGDEAASTGQDAVGVALAFERFKPDSQGTSIEQALGFLKSQEAPMANVSDGLARMMARRAAMPDGLIGPMGSATADFDRAITKLGGLVDGYDRADALLPSLLGYDAPVSYLVLPENDTELFPSGGLISSYGIATFDKGKLASVNLEYFGTLFDRWQKATHEYVEPPAPLKNYLLKDLSWGLGEAGWYPDFPTTAKLAGGFVAKGGAPPTDGTIAVDTQFMSALLRLLGPVKVPEYDVTVNADNVTSITLEYTRQEFYEPGQPKKAFLSYLSREVLDKLFATPKSKWVDLLRLLDEQGKERHLQFNFGDAKLQRLASEYGLDGSLNQAKGDYLLIADTSVNSTKLNLIMEPSARLDVALDGAGNASSLVTYATSNPLPQWQQDKDPHLVSELMLDGVYGSYLRIYVPQQSHLQDVLLHGNSSGAEQNDVELGRAVFGRFFPVLPGQTGQVQFAYQTPGVATQDKDGVWNYSLYLQKEAGTRATPITVRVTLPKGAEVVAASINGKSADGTTFNTDLLTDRQIEISYRLP